MFSISCCFCPAQCSPVKHNGHSPVLVSQGLSTSSLISQDTAQSQETKFPQATSSHFYSGSTEAELTDILLSTSILQAPPLLPHGRSHSHAQGHEKACLCLTCSRTKTMLTEFPPASSLESLSEAQVIKPTELNPNDHGRD